jgi:hypothetical protein
MTTPKRSYSAGSFELAIDGHPTQAYVKSVDGGNAKANQVQEPIGAFQEKIRHLSTVEIDPFSLEIGMAGAEPILKWIRQSWRREFSRRNGVITHADFNYHKQFEHEFHEALISEVTLPALDGSSKEAAYLKMKVQPEWVEWRKAKSDERVTGKVLAKQKLWLCNAFRLTIDGLSEMEYTNRIESFTIKQNVVKHYSGVQRFPTIEPTRLEFPSLQGSIALEYADGLIEWHKQSVYLGQADTKAQKTGSLEFLHPDRKQAIFRINLYEIGLTTLSFPTQTANANEIKRVKFELFVGRMDLDTGGQGGFGD